MATATPQEFSTVIGADAKFKGELAFEGGVRIDGQFEGSIKTSGKVLVSQGGKTKAEIEAGTISVDGDVEGNLVAQSKVELNATCKLNGDVKASKLMVKEGAVFIGRCEVGGSAPKGKPQPVDNLKTIADAASGKK